MPLSLSWSFLRSDTSSRVTTRQCKALISRTKRIKLLVIGMMSKARVLDEIRRYWKLTVKST